MIARHDILDRPESLRNPLLGSLAAHVGLAAAVVVYGMLPASAVLRWGDPNSLGGGSVAVTPVSKIPLPPRAGRVNPVANDTESQVPAPPAQAKPQPKPKPAVKDEPDAIPLKSRKAESARRPQRASSSRRGEDADNQLYNPGGAAAVTPMFGSTATGSGTVGIGEGNPFGDRFGSYVAIIRQMVASKWNTSQVDARLQTAPMVIVIFDIQRDGGARNVRLLQRSGVSTLDYSAMRAIMEASPFPPLPRGFERNAVTVEFHFQLKR
ncbi:MAG: TonB family protein [Bryobacteraceae bacterium]|nr:TonB family protein [Bryobacteraceae bacterium]